MLTRQRMVDAAFELFAARGFQPTTFSSVAELAEVSEAFVYFTFHNKAGLLGAVLDARRGSPGEPNDVEQRDWYGAALVEPDPTRAIELMVIGGSGILERLAPLAEALAAAVRIDPGVAELHRDNMARKRAAIEALFQPLAERGALALPAERAADVFEVVQSLETFNGLVRDHGWTPEEFSTWSIGTLTTTLLRARHRPDETTKGMGS
ncbi:TetR/AcrR family transcriptional regulator [Agromyces sp. NPDC057679]|uniref:TetR/AcrR family transcriptional regulator n=1 Tax=Agromyces sp. NPDC057679 TaxID=3346207 RepID=UPI00366FED6B